MSAWPSFAPRLGGGLRNVRYTNIGKSFDLGNITLPVGYGGLAPSIVPSSRIPQLVTTPTQPPQTTLPPAIDRRDVPPLSGQNKVSIQATDWIDYWAKKAEGLNVLPPTAQSRAAPIVSSQPVSKSMDLGALISDLGSQYIQTKFAPPAPSLFPTVPAVAAGAAAAAGAMGVGLPFVDVIPGMPDAKACGGRPVYKYHCGEYKWVYPKRRRRKALATQSDLRGLAALKGVLGQGKAFEVWIATHS
jgi:hypothetical protein